MKKRYIIFAPLWHHRSSGLMVLKNLMNALIRAGYDCIYYPFGSGQTAINEVNDNDVVIYPEIVSGNPLGAKNVARWLLNNPGVCGGDGIYDKKDMIFQYLPKYKHPKSLGLLTPPYISEYMVNMWLERQHDCIWVYKGAWKQRMPIAGVEITPSFPKHKHELAELLNHCKTLYTYDDNTGLANEARACGCKVLLVNGDGTLSPYHFADDEQFSKFPEQLNNFIKITQGE